MSDLISRSALIEDIKRRKYINKPLAEIFETIIDDQPTVEPVRGEWIAQDEGLTKFMCSHCKARNYDGSGNFCPNCGADMRKKVER